MEKPHPVLERLSRGQSIVLDGSVASELARRGYRPTGPMRDAAAAREAPDLLAAVHKAYVDAGADVITAFTSRTTVRALSKGGFGMRAAALTSRAMDIAFDVAQQSLRPVAVAGALAALEDLAHPERTPSSRTLADEHAEQATRLAASGCHVILVEPMPTVRETLAAVAAARNTGRPVWAVLPLRGKGLLLDGTALDAAAQYAVAVGAASVLIDGPVAAEVTLAVGTLAGLALGAPLGARTVRSPDEASTAERFAAELAVAMTRGARILGGSHGTTPEQIRALAAVVRARAAA